MSASRSRGTVVRGGLLGPAEVEFIVEDWWHGRRTVTIGVYPGEVEVLRDR